MGSESRRGSPNPNLNPNLGKRVQARPSTQPKANLKNKSVPGRDALRCGTFDWPDSPQLRLAHSCLVFRCGRERVLFHGLRFYVCPTPSLRAGEGSATTHTALNSHPNHPTPTAKVDDSFTHNLMGSVRYHYSKELRGYAFAFIAITTMDPQEGQLQGTASPSTTRGSAQAPPDPDPTEIHTAGSTDIANLSISPEQWRALVYRFAQEDLKKKHFFSSQI